MGIKLPRNNAMDMNSVLNFVISAGGDWDRWGRISDGSGEGGIHPLLSLLGVLLFLMILAKRK